MEVYCTRSGCPHPQNNFADLDDSTMLKTVQQKYCTTCGMPLILVGRYLPLKLLGQGGFGAAFLARDRYTPRMRSCVVKQFKPAGELTATQLEIAQKLFEREAEVLEEIGNQHDQIPDLFAFFELTVPSVQPPKQDSFFYLVQEFIDGKNLEEELALKGKFSEAEVLELLWAILPVLKFVHENGSIHRDIKPSNIMRDRNGKLYLLDFGAVKQVAKVAASAAKGSTGIYSMGFAPPEQMAGGEVYPSTDLYALAVTAVMLLTGMDATELFDAYSNQWNWRTQATVSDALADVLNRMLISAPNQRFQSAAEVMAALTPAKTPVPLQPPSRPVATSSPPAPPARLTFSTLELLSGAAFSGFEGALMAIALYSLLQSQLITLGISALILGVLIFAQTRRWIEKWDLLIIAGITFAIFFIPILRGTLSIPEVALMAVVAGLIAIAFWWFTRKSGINLGELTSSKSDNPRPNNQTLPPRPSSRQSNSDFASVQNVPSGLFNYGGSTSWAPIRLTIDSAIQAARPEFRLRYVEPTSEPPSSGSGIRMLLDGRLAFAQSSRPILDQELTRAQQRGFGLKQIPIAIDGLAVAVNPNLDIPGLTIDQLKSIYTGKTTNWKQLGGPDVAIKPYSRPTSNGGTVELFVQDILGQAFGPNVEFVSTTTQALRKLADNPGGIYYASAPEVVPQCTIKSLPLGRKPDELIPPYQEPFVPLSQCPSVRNRLNIQAFQTAQYPITRNLYVVVKQNDQIDEQAGEIYANFLLTPQGQELIAQTGFVKIR